WFGRVGAGRDVEGRVAVRLMMRAWPPGQGGCSGHWLRRRRARARNGRRLVGLPIALSRVPAAVARRPPDRTERLRLARVRSWRGGGGPQEAGELARDGDGGDVGGLVPLAQAALEAVQAVLGAPGDGQHVVGLAGLA